MDTDREVLKDLHKPVKKKGKIGLLKIFQLKELNITSESLSKSQQRAAGGGGRGSLEVSLQICLVLYEFHIFSIKLHRSKFIYFFYLRV